MKKLLTIAGSDSSGGAGIQADLKTFAALGAYGMSCICTLTAQNTTGVSMVVNTPVEMVTAQLEAVYSDIPPDGVKTGMLSTPAIVSAVAEFLRGHKGPAIVVDPVMVATTGAVLLEKEAIETYKDILIPEADLITPNIPEAKVLSGLEIKTEKDMENAAERIMEYGCRAVLVKGGHLVHDAVDILFDGKQFYRYEGKRIKTKKHPRYGLHAFRSARRQTGGRGNADEGCCGSKRISYRRYRGGKRRNHRTGQRPGSSFLALWNKGEIICILFLRTLQE